MSYQTPTVTDHGTLAQLTATTTVGTQLDAAIPAGTPLSQLPGHHRHLAVLAPSSLFGICGPA